MGRKRAIETVTRLEERKMVMMILKLVMMIKNDHDVEDGVDDDDDDDYDDDDYDEDGCMFCSNLHKRPGEVRGVRGYSGFQVTGMIEWGQKSKPNKILKASYNPP